MPQPYAVDVLSLIDLVERSLAQAETMMEMYQEGLEPSEYARIFAEHSATMKKRCEMLRSAVENPAAFAQAIAGFQSIDLKTRKPQ